MTEGGLTLLGFLVVLGPTLLRGFGVGVPTAQDQVNTPFFFPWAGTFGDGLRAVSVAGSCVVLLSLCLAHVVLLSLGCPLLKICVSPSTRFGFNGLRCLLPDHTLNHGQGKKPETKPLSVHQTRNCTTITTPHTRNQLLNPTAQHRPSTRAGETWTVRSRTAPWARRQLLGTQVPARSPSKMRRAASPCDLPAFCRFSHSKT